MGTRGEWATDFAKALGNDNPSASLVNWISAWTLGENTAARYNPLATTLPWDNATDFNTAHVKNYASRADGVAATVQTLQGNHNGYRDIREGIQSNDPARAANGLIAAPWGTNGTAVKLHWQTSDTRGQRLLSEPETDPSGGKIPEPRDTPLPDPRSLPPPRDGVGPTPDPVGGGGSGTHTPLPWENSSGDVQSAIKVIGGAGLIVIALWLGVRKFVPTKQIVETVTKAAAVAA